MPHIPSEHVLSQSEIAENEGMDESSICEVEGHYGGGRRCDYDAQNHHR